MTKYEVGISHSAFGLMWIMKIDADSEEEAKEKALYEAAHNEWTDHSEQYQVAYVKEREEMNIKERYILT